ncbi:MAG TPA: YfhO family protein, partial [Pyrinomonadaceae bacterium]
YNVIYHIPLLNRFRVPARHTFEWTFAAAVLSAYGWDIVATYLERKRQTGTYTKALTLYGSISLLGIATVVGVVWWLKSRTMKLDVASWPNAETYYHLFKIVFGLLTAAALWRAALIKFNRPRFAICLTAVLLLSFVEPSLLINRFWGSWGFRSWRFSQVTEATKFFHQFPAEQNRVYTRVFLMHEQFDNPPEFDSGNLNAIQHIHNLAGYEPLVLERFSRALGDVGLDGVATTRTGEPDDSLYTERSHVLDILNTTFTLSYINFRPSFSSPQHRWTSEEPTKLGDMAPTTSRNLTVQSGADSILLITSLSNSVDVPQGSIVGKVRITTVDGKVIERDLQAGIDTAEWAHERPDVLVRIKHQLATPYEHIDIPGKDGFRAYRYRTELPLGAFKEVRLVEITNLSPSANLALLGVGLVDSQTKKTVFLSPPYSGFWKKVYEKEYTIILRNERAMPRAWLVTGAEAVDGEEALRRIRGESPKDFDPRQSVLLEVNQDELPRLSGGPLPSDSGAKITSYKPNSLEIETNAPVPTVLVVSEMFYPGWVATIDGQSTRILLADFLLRGISVPAGKHTISMRYTAPAARYGAMISAATIIGLIGLIVVAYRRRHRPTLTSESDS